MSKFIKKFENFDNDSQNDSEYLLSKLTEEFNNLNAYKLSDKHSDTHAYKYVYYGKTPNDIIAKYRPRTTEFKPWIKIREDLNPFAVKPEFKQNEYRPVIIKYFEDSLDIEIESLSFSNKDELVGRGTLRFLKNINKEDE